MFRSLLVGVFLLIANVAWAQPIQCPDRPNGDSSNACANTRFVQNNGGGGGGGSPGGSSGQVQYNNAGSFGGFTLGGDCAIAVPAAGTIVCTKTNGVSFGTSATVNTGTSGATIPLLSTANTWTLAQTFTAAPVFSDAAGSRTALGLGTIAVLNANNVGVLSGAIAPSANSDVANKLYVDNSVAGLTCTLASTRLATTAALAANTYANGASGVGATLTANANGAIANIDGTAVVLADRILVINEATAANRGLYTATALGDGSNPYILTRATDFDQAAEMQAGCHTFITAGATNINKTYVLQTAVATVGTDAVTFIQTSVSSSSQWTTSGLDIYYNTGNVGIGTIAPATLLHITGAGTTAVQEFTRTNASESFTIGQSSQFAGIQGNRNIATGTIFNSGLPSAYMLMQIASADSSLQFGTSATNNVAATERMRINKTGDVGIGTTTPAVDACVTCRYLTVNNATADAPSEINIGGNAVSTNTYVGTIGFWNSSLGSAEKRVATVTSKVGAATNTGNIEFRTTNAGSFVQNLALQPYGLTNVIGGFSVNADFQVGTDITSALNTALATYNKVQLPCGTFLVSSPVNFGLASQTLSGCGREGTILQVTGAGAIAYIVNVSSLANTGMYDLTIDGNNASGLTGGCALATASPKTKWIRVGCIHTTTAANNAAGFALASSSNTAATSSRWSEIRDCYMEDIQAINSAYNSHSILLQYADYSSVIGCTSVNIDNGVNTQASNWVNVSNNVFVGNSSAASPTGFGGIRCSNGTVGATITGNIMRDMARGIFLLGCQNTAVTGNSITNTQLQSILVSATTGNASPTQYNTVSGNTMQDTCLANGCNYAIEFNTGGGGSAVGNVAIGNSYIRVSTPVSTAMIGISGGVSAGQNTCANNTASITVGTC